MVWSDRNHQGVPGDQHEVRLQGSLHRLCQQHEPRFQHERMSQGSLQHSAIRILAQVLYMIMEKPVILVLGDQMVPPVLSGYGTFAIVIWVDKATPLPS